MMLFRSARNADLEAIHHLAEISGTGMTTLPKDKKLLKKRLNWSSSCFKKEVALPHNEYYLFVLENPLTKEIIGISAIESKIGHEAPFYSYKVSRRTRICPTLKIRSDYELLSLVNDNQGHSEICTLFLNPQNRQKNNGLLLSAGRFLFMAQHPARFAPIVIADMRGISDEHGISPFWKHVGSHFFHMSYAEADRLTLATDKQFIADLMPRNPLYVSLLAPEAQAVIGQAHPGTKPALNILVKQGFRYNGYIDIFDAGPTLEAPLSQIKTIAYSQKVRVNSISDEVSSARYLLAHSKNTFYATINFALVNAMNKSCVISKDTAEVLQARCGDTLLVSPLNLPDSAHD